MAQAQDGRRTRIIRPYPTYTLRDAIRVPNAIQEANAGLPFARELLAGALGTTHKSSGFTTRINASAAYGLTEGGYNDPDISLTELGTTITAAKTSVDGGDAERERAVIAAATTPDTFRRFYELFDDKQLPAREYLGNILQRELGIQAELTDECLDILRDNGIFAGIITERDGRHVVNLPPKERQDAPPSPTAATAAHAPNREQQSAAQSEKSETQRRAIFVGHIGRSDAAEHIASTLEEFGISCVRPQTAGGANGGLLVSPEVSGAMRECGAAVLALGGDGGMNALYQMIGMLGAASALFYGRVALLYEKGAQPNIGAGELAQVEFDRERPGESTLNALKAMHKAGIISISA